MKLGSLRSSKSRDGELCVISRDCRFAVKATHIVPSLREALENWEEVYPKLNKISDKLNSGDHSQSFPIKEEDFLSALPRTWLFADGSAFLHHVKLVRMARKAPLPETLYTVPLMYQAESGKFLSPHEDIPQIDVSHGTDFEGEVGVIVDDVPMGISPERALSKIRLLVLINDTSLRGLIPEELAQGFGFFQSKPAKALSPFAVTPDELGDAWKGGRLHLPLHVRFNGKFFGNADAGAMHFHFGELIAHAARTRDLVAGSLIGSGTCLLYTS
ncbi:MAG: fumarylacetoacetate hydrolase family protein, partial [Bdellovibrionaceae bacterium]|nr:fumarylacetoacetate hydrolase family protein [Pseudobdellovibrionaceae bacterium]